MGRETYEFDAARYVDEDATTAYAVPATDGGHYVVGTVEEAFNEGLKDAHDRAEAEFRETWEADEEETTEWDEIPA